MTGSGKKLTRRQMLGRVAATSAMLSPALSGTRSVAASAPSRKNIDALSGDELETYEFAVKALMDRSASQPNATNGYAWQARLHNDFGRVRPDGSEGACEHASELFFPWHRAHLAGFEKLLREVEPARTANVTIPYWDWSKPASGMRFPKAFERAASPLFHAGRYQTAANVPSLPTLLKNIQWDAEDLKNKMVKEPDWYLFAGRPRGADGTGGSYGWVEAAPHNTIHSSIGPTMGNPATASRDPIYWSFHAYIDLIWARWQRVNTSATKPQPFATPDTKIWVEPFTPVVAQTAQTMTMPTGYTYGYDYDFSIDAAPPPLVAVQAMRRTGIAAMQTDGAFATAPPIRVQGPGRKLLHVEDVAVFPDLTYALQVYVHPTSVDVTKLSSPERSKYLADRVTIWMSGGHRHHPSDVFFDLTKAMASASTDVVISIIPEALPLAPNVAATAAMSTTASRTIKDRGPLWRSLTIEER